ncbi:hypothetical protein I6N96_18450 [Enterococcus sp. BWM-S5]|uniref:Lipoprotein n=1 Tax=Enterococcus larvae TaxID=2794352 RepID=A0ABS4CR72_9ENTE|nr:hypothetical protein [Enterococcus larvae]MBP1048279.1 hypothetical protein [Enterococcus larvae]
MKKYLYAFYNRLSRRKVSVASTMDKKVGVSIYFFYRIYVFCLILLVPLLSSCANREAVDSFDKQFKEEAAKIYKQYSSRAFQQGEVELNTFVQLSGVITVTDNQDGCSIKKNDRFILEVEGDRYQVINYSDSEWELTERVTVYGEYYGFIKAEEIKNEL